jgi:hypothetical protein
MTLGELAPRNQSFGETSYPEDEGSRFVHSVIYLLTIVQDVACSFQNFHLH